MKIKEVCERTGLTRRAVRFYEEKGLVSPDIDAGNEYRDYSEADVRRLQLVARLRELRFSVDRIRRVLERPQEAEAVFDAHRRELADEHAECGTILAALEGLRLPSGGGPDALLAALERAESVPLPPPPDLEPDFGRFEDLTREERARLSARSAERLGRMDRTRRRRRAAIGAALTVFVLVFAAAGLWFRVETEEVSCLGILGADVVFSSVGWDEEAGAVAARFEADLTEPDGVERRAALCLPLPGAEAGDVLGKAILPGAAYAGFSYRIALPRRDARALGLLLPDGSLDIPAALDRMLPDEEFALRYASLTAVHSGWGGG